MWFPRLWCSSYRPTYKTVCCKRFFQFEVFQKDYDLLDCDALIGPTCNIVFGKDLFSLRFYRMRLWFPKLWSSSIACETFWCLALFQMIGWMWAAGNQIFLFCAHVDFECLFLWFWCSPHIPFCYVFCLLILRISQFEISIVAGSCWSLLAYPTHVKATVQISISNNQSTLPRCRTTSWQ